MVEDLSAEQEDAMVPCMRGVYAGLTVDTLATISGEGSVHCKWDILEDSESNDLYFS